MPVLGSLAFLALSGSLFPKPLPREDALFDWFDSLKIGGLKGRPFVQVEVWYGERPTDSQGIWRIEGFLTAGGQGGGRVRTLRLDEQTYPPPNWLSKGLQIRVHPLQFLEWARYRLGELRYQLAGWTAPRSQNWGFSSTECFVLSDLLRAQSPSLAAEFLALAKRSDTDAEFEQRIKNELATVLMFEATRVTSDRSYSLAEVERQFRLVAEKFPDSPLAAQASELATGYRSHMRDAMRGAVSDRKIKRLAREEQAGAWIRRLPEVGGMESYISFLGSSTTGSRFNPLTELSDLGWDAVPTLIEALGDPRPTRLVQDNPRWEPPFMGQGYARKVYRVGELAMRALQVISNHQIAPQGEFKDWPSRAAACQELARTWWHSRGPMGERKFLIDQVSAGGNSAYESALRLTNRYPEDAPPAIRKGIKNSPQPGNLVALLLRDTSEERFSLAQEIIEDSEDESSYFNACRVLSLKDLPASVMAIGDFLTRHTTSERRVFRSYMIEFLLACGLPEGVRTVRELLAKASPQERSTTLWYFLRDLPLRRQWPIPDKLKLPTNGELRREYLHEIEGLLQNLLEDETVIDNSSVNLSGLQVIGPRIADMAQCALAKYWPEKYRFKATPSPQGMEVQRISNLNVVRRSKGQAHLPMLSRPQPAAIDRDLCQRLFRAEDARVFERELAFAKSQGLRVLPTLREVSKAVDLPLDNRVAVEVAISELALIVQSVDIETRVEVDPRWLERLEAFRGKPLQSTGLRDVLLEAMGAWPVGLGSIWISVTGEGDGTGLTLKVSFRPEPAPSSGEVWSHHAFVQAGARVRFQDGGGGTFGTNPLRFERFGWFASALDEALRSVSTEVVHARFKLTRPDPWPPVRRSPNGWSR